MSKTRQIKKFVCVQQCQAGRDYREFRLYNVGEVVEDFENPKPSCFMEVGKENHDEERNELLIKLREFGTRVDDGFRRMPMKDLKRFFLEKEREYLRKEAQRARDMESPETISRDM